MKDKLQSINDITFVACLATLLLNDFYLKLEYHNWLTGKLSDFCGLFVFVWFWSALAPGKKNIIHVLSGVLFVIWKSPYSQSFIDLFSQNVFPIYRVVDITDLIALTVLPISYYYKPARFNELKLNPIPLAVLTLFSFCATSIHEPTQRFAQPQYLLLKAGIVNIESSMDSSDYQVYTMDSLLVINVKEIRIGKTPPLHDEFHKVQILKDLDLRFLREVNDEHGDGKLADYEKLRDSLTIDGATKIMLKHNSAIDSLEFFNVRLHGSFKRFSDKKLLIEGKYRNGIEDSIWVFYNSDGETISKKYFEKGELVRADVFEKSKLKSQDGFNTRQQTIRKKYFHVAILLFQSYV